MRIMHCLNIMNHVRFIPGDVIELGVSIGTTTFPLSDLMSEITPKKLLYACDTYTGLPYDEKIKNGFEMKKGECNGGSTFKQIMTIRQRKNIVMVEGLVEETLPLHLSKTIFCFAWIDMDLYEPTSFAYKFLENKMHVGGIMGFHDYGYVRCPGIKKIVDQEIDREKYKRVLLANNCMFLQRVK